MRVRTIVLQATLACTLLHIITTFKIHSYIQYHIPTTSTTHTHTHTHTHANEPSQEGPGRKGIDSAQGPILAFHGKP